MIPLKAHTITEAGMEALETRRSAHTWKEKKEDEREERKRKQATRRQRKEGEGRQTIRRQPVRTGSHPTCCLHVNGEVVQVPVVDPYDASAHSQRCRHFTLRVHFH